MAVCNHLYANTDWPDGTGWAVAESSSLDGGNVGYGPAWHAFQTPFTIPTRNTGGSRSGYIEVGEHVPRAGALQRYVPRRAQVRITVEIVEDARLQRRR